MKAKIFYTTMSGNTEETAQFIEHFLYTEHDFDGVELVDIWGYDDLNVKDTDVIFIGSYTWDYGLVPIEMECFVEDYQNSMKYIPVYIFGTGDTQFGGKQIYCKAVDTLVDDLNVKTPGLKIEQSPRGTQVNTIYEWLDFINRNGGFNIC